MRIKLAETIPHCYGDIQSKLAEDGIPQLYSFRAIFNISTLIPGVIRNCDDKSSGHLIIELYLLLKNCFLRWSNAGGSYQPYSLLVNGTAIYFLYFKHLFTKMSQSNLHLKKIKTINPRK